MADPMKIRAAMSGDKVEVKVLMSHEMETGQRKDSKGAVDPGAWFIQNVTATHNGKTVLSARMGPGGVEEPVPVVQVRGRQAGRQGDRSPGPTTRATSAPTKRRFRRAGGPRCRGDDNGEEAMMRFADGGRRGSRRSLGAARRRTIRSRSSTTSTTASSRRRTALRNIRTTTSTADPTAKIVVVTHARGHPLPAATAPRTGTAIRSTSPVEDLWAKGVEFRVCDITLERPQDRSQAGDSRGEDRPLGRGGGGPPAVPGRVRLPEAVASRPSAPRQQGTEEQRESNLERRLAPPLPRWRCRPPARLAQQRTAVEEIERYRAALGDGNPAELWEARGEDLWKAEARPEERLASRNATSASAPAS